MLGQIISGIMIVISLVGGFLSMGQPQIGIAIMISGTLFGAYLFDVARKLDSVQIDLESIHNRSKIDGAYLKLLTYTNAPPEQLIEFARSGDLFTRDQMATLNPMVTAMRKAKAQSDAKANQEADGQSDKSSAPSTLVWSKPPPDAWKR